MDSLGDYIYLLVIAIAGISSFLGKRKKKREVVQESGPDFPDLDDVIPEFEPFFQEEASNPDINQEVVSPKKKEPVSRFETMNDGSKGRPENENKTLVNQNENRIRSDNNAGSDEIELNTPDEVKKAFIYSEILNRRY